MQLLLPIFRADFALFENYNYVTEDAVACPITAFAGQGDSRARPQAVADWQEHTYKEFTMHILPGDHFFLHQAQREILEIISSTLKPFLKQNFGV